MKSKKERLEAKIERIKKLFPNPQGSEAKQVEAAIAKAEKQLKELPQTE